jgi:glycopeptide antibiotics resistance protein
VPVATGALARLGRALVVGTILAAIFVTQWPFHYHLTRFGIGRRWARIQWSWFPRTNTGAILFDRDFALNLAMLVPLGVGFGLWRRAPPVRRVVEGLALGLGVSVLLELAQLLTPYRYTSIADVWRNGLGCMVGCMLATWFQRRRPV